MNARELQTLRNIGNECEQAADEIERLTAERDAARAGRDEIQTQSIALLNALEAENETLRKALSIVREHPAFDQGGPLPTMMDRVLLGEPSTLIKHMDAWHANYDSVLAAQAGEKL